jgi:hypothetical protein
VLFDLALRYSLLPKQFERPRRCDKRRRRNQLMRFDLEKFTDRQRASWHRQRASWTLNIFSDRQRASRYCKTYKFCFDSYVCRRHTDNAQIHFKQTTESKNVSSRPTTGLKTSVFDTDPPFTSEPTGRVRIDVEGNGFHRSNQNRWADIIAPDNISSILNRLDATGDCSEKYRFFRSTPPSKN